MIFVPKCWNYKIGQRVWINGKADYFYPGSSGKVGEIIELLEQGTLDYGVHTADGSFYRLKEEEVYIISEVDE